MKRLLSVLIIIIILSFNISVFAMPGEASISILLPLDGYTDNSWLYSFYTYITYEEDEQYKLNDTTIKVFIDDVDISTMPSLEKEITRSFVEKEGNTAKWYFNMSLEIPVGEKVVTFKLVDKNDNTIVLASDEVTINRVEGFIDENQDGLDDRTGKTDESKKPVYLDDLDKNTDAIKYLTGQVNAMTEIFSSFVSIMPQEWVLMGIGVIAIYVALRVLGR